MGHTPIYEYLQTLRRRYKVKRREAPPSQPTCSSEALRSVGCFGCANSRLASVISQKQMCAKLRTLPSLPPVSRSCSTDRKCRNRMYNCSHCRCSSRALSLYKNVSKYTTQDINIMSSSIISPAIIKPITMAIGTLTSAIIAFSFLLHLCSLGAK